MTALARGCTFVYVCTECLRTVDCRYAIEHAALLHVSPRVAGKRYTDIRPLVLIHHETFLNMLNAGLLKFNYARGTPFICHSGNIISFIYIKNFPVSCNL